MRMYGRENSDVVKLTNAVSDTRNTLNGSMKNCSCAAVMLPSPITRIVNAAAASSVARLNAALASGAQRRAPNRARHAAPTIGLASRVRNSTLLLFLQRLEVVQVKAVELLADLEEEHAEHEHRDQHVERDAEL